MQKLRIGNVIRTAYGSNEIVAEVMKKGVTTISLKYSSSKSFHNYETTYPEYCDCNEPECEDCKTGREIKIGHLGLDRATFLADNVEDWIKKTLLAGFKI